MVDPASASVEVLTLGPNGLETWRVFPMGTAAVSPLLPDFSIAVDDLFAE